MPPRRLPRLVRGVGLQANLQAGRQGDGGVMRCVMDQLVVQQNDEVRGSIRFEEHFVVTGNSFQTRRFRCCDAHHGIPTSHAVGHRFCWRDRSSTFH